MSHPDGGKLRLVREYHERTKHRPERYAASLGYMDWANQPDPFRTFAGTEQIALPHPGLREAPTYDHLFQKSSASAPLDAELVGRLFYHSLALSAWKQGPLTNPWSLRISPSSGALYPTEGYLICGSVPGLVDQPGVFHYAPFRHQLERRCLLAVKQWETLTDGFPRPCLLIGLTSIYWRESWKYGERAFRYCHHDVGHAIGAVAFSARTLGWATRLLETVADDDLDSLMGTCLQTGVEAEHADCLLALYPTAGDGHQRSLPSLSADQWRRRLPSVAFTGEPNRLSRDHRAWPAIEDVSAATRGVPEEPLAARTLTSDAAPISRLADRNHSAERIIRQRRSAVAMDRTTPVDRTAFCQMLQRTLPARFPFDALPWSPRVSLGIFVHRVHDMEPGLYVLVRDESHEEALRRSMALEFRWQSLDGIGRGLPLFCLMPGDVRRTAKAVSCDQDIAGDGAFSLGMLADFDAALTAGGARFYPRMFWETGLIGQVLYLEAEAAGVRGTGIGCFFDDLMHQMLGISDRSWQSLYHFTVGGPIEDARLKTLPPYAHLAPAE